jgi:DNA-directed RNA polymerase specialized sigma24 family protein
VKNKRKHDISHNRDKRLRQALEFCRTLERRRNLPVEVLDSVRDDLVDLLEERSDLGNTKGAVFALGRRILGWRIADSMRSRMTPDGEMRAHPAAATSLDAEFVHVDGEGGSLYGSIADHGACDPERVVLVREELGEIIRHAVEEGPRALAVIQGEMRGLTVREIAISHGVSENVVHKWGSRFRISLRENRRQ